MISQHSFSIKKNGTQHRQHSAQMPISITTLCHNAECRLLFIAILYVAKTFSITSNDTYRQHDKIKQVVLNK
jgi:hypothetical protein